MKKLILTLIVMLLAASAYAKPIEGGVSFDWISKTQIQRDENIKEIKDILFGDIFVIKFDKKAFRESYSDFLKDPEYKEHYNDVVEGVTEIEGGKIAGFYLKDKILISYALQFDNNNKKVYYYDALGGLRYVDMLSDNYPKYPYFSRQYSVNGNMVGTIYFVSHDDQYVYEPDGTFKGRWYKEKMYNKNAKVVLTRTNY